MPSGQRLIVFNGVIWPDFHESMVIEECSKSRVGQ